MRRLREVHENEGHEEEESATRALRIKNKVKIVSMRIEQAEKEVD